MRGREFIAVWRACWPCAGYVCYVAAVFAACVYEDGVVGVDRCIVGDVVDCVCVSARCYDRDISTSVASVETEIVFDFVSECAFRCPAAAHGGGVCTTGHAAYVAEEGDFCGRFYAAEIV